MNSFKASLVLATPRFREICYIVPWDVLLYFCLQARTSNLTQYTSKNQSINTHIQKYGLSTQVFLMQNEFVEETWIFPYADLDNWRSGFSRCK